MDTACCIILPNLTWTRVLIPHFQCIRYCCYRPNPQVWDRLPMTLGFMSIYSIVLHERLQLFRLLPTDALTTLAAAASNPAGSDLV